ncbi:MAG: glycosyltransferase family 4 protein, partial [Ignavibacteriaceae bacterium]
MNILIINHYAGSLKNGFEFRPYYFGKEFIKRGHNVFIICSSFSHLRKINPKPAETISEEIIDGIKYYWIKTPSYSGNGIKRVINIFSFIFILYTHLKGFIKAINPDVVVASSTYPLDIFPAAGIAKLSNAELIFEVHDLWPLTPVEIGGMSKKNLFIMLLQIGENFACRKADKVISILPCTKKYLIEHGMSPDKFQFIPNGIDLKEWEKDIDLPGEVMELILGLKNKNNFLVGYAGSIGLANALEFLIDAAEILRDRSVSFLILGEGPDKEKLLEKSRHLKNVYFLSPIQKDAVPKYLKMMDVLYIGFRSKPIYRFGVGTNKMYEYMMAGKPIVQSQRAGNDLVKENDCGISVIPENPELIADAIIALHS